MRRSSRSEVGSLVQERDERKVPISGLFVSGRRMRKRCVCDMKSGYGKAVTVCGTRVAL